MRRVILLLIAAIMAAACTEHAVVAEKEIANAYKVCADNGGLAEVRASNVGPSYQWVSQAYCRNGARFYFPHKVSQ